MKLFDGLNKRLGIHEYRLKYFGVKPFPFQNNPEEENGYIITTPYSDNPVQLRNLLTLKVDKLTGLYPESLSFSHLKGVEAGLTIATDEYLKKLAKEIARDTNLQTVDLIVVSEPKKHDSKFIITKLELDSYIDEYRNNRPDMDEDTLTFKRNDLSMQKNYVSNKFIWTNWR